MNDAPFSAAADKRRSFAYGCPLVVVLPSAPTTLSTTITQQDQRGHEEHLDRHKKRHICIRRVWRRALFIHSRLNGVAQLNALHVMTLSLNASRDEIPIRRIRLSAANAVRCGRAVGTIARPFGKSLLKHGTELDLEINRAC